MRVTEAAIRIGKLIWTGFDHGVAFQKASKAGADMSKHIQGFVTTRGQFLTRAEAFEAAVRNNQIQDRGEKGKDRILVSEQLHREDPTTVPKKGEV